MSVITLDRAKQHLREFVSDSSNDELITGYIDAAESYAAAYLGRFFYATDDALQQAKAGARSALENSLAAADAVDTDADAITDETLKASIKASASGARLAAQSVYRMTQSGMIVNGSITSACLLMVGNLYANRESVVDSRAAVELPLGTHRLLDLYRANLGV